MVKLSSFAMKPGTFHSSSFFKDIHRQCFPFASPIINYITMNPSNTKTYQKLIQTCKYFFTKNPLLIFQRFEFNEHNTWDASNYFESGCYKIRKSGAKFWCTEFLSISSYHKQELYLASSLISHFFQCQCVQLVFLNQNISFNDLGFLTKNVKICSLINVTVLSDDGNVTPFENIFNVIPQILKFMYKFGSNFQNVSSETVKTLINLPTFQQLLVINLYKIPETFDVETFYEYAKENVKTNFHLAFADETSEDFKNQLSVVVDRFINNLNCFPPIIYYSGVDHSKLKTIHVKRKKFLYPKIKYV